MATLSATSSVPRHQAGEHSAVARQRERRRLCWDDAVKMSVPIECACQYKLRLTRAMAFDGRGNTDSAIVWYDRYMQPLMLRGAALAPLQRRLGVLYEGKGDVEHALMWYGRFLKAWKHADPELRPQIEDVTRRVARLRAREAAKR